MELRLEAKIEGVKAESLKWMFGAMAAQTGLIVALIKLLPAAGCGRPGRGGRARA